MTQTSNSREVATRQTSQKIQTVGDIFRSEGFKKQIAAALPRHISVDSYWRICLTLVRINPQLADCTPESFMGAMLQSAQVGLRPGVQGEAHLIPRWNSKTHTLECNYQPGYQGVAQLALRSNEVADLCAYPVYKDDEFDYALGDNAHIDHRPSVEVEPEEENIILFYSVVHLVNGGTLREVMTKAQVDKVRDRFAPKAKGGSKVVGPWVTDYTAMGRKTVLLRALKLAPKSTELARVVEDSYRADMAFAGDIDVPAAESETITPEQSAELATLAATKVAEGQVAETIRHAAEMLGYAGAQLDKMPSRIWRALMDSFAEMPDVVEGEAEEEDEQQESEQAADDEKTEKPKQRRGRPPKITSDQHDRLMELWEAFAESEQQDRAGDVKEIAPKAKNFGDLSKDQADELLSRWNVLAAERAEDQAEGDAQEGD